MLLSEHLPARHSIARAEAASSWPRLETTVVFISRSDQAHLSYLNCLSCLVLVMSALTPSQTGEKNDGKGAAQVSKKKSCERRCNRSGAHPTSEHVIARDTGHKMVDGKRSEPSLMPYYFLLVLS